MARSRKRELLLTSDGKGGYQYWMSGPSAGGRYAGVTSKSALEESLSGIQYYYRAIRRGAGTLSNGQYTSTITNLTGLGNSLYRALIPDELRSETSRMKQGDHLNIVEDDFRIPWELVRNGGEFWGRRFIISHRKTKARLRLRQTDREVKRVVNVVGAGIPAQVKTRASALFDGRASKSDCQVETILGEGDPDATAKVFERFSSADIIHFTCHGHIQNGGLYLQIVEDSTDMLNVTVPAIRTKPIKPGCLIFANACVSSTTQHHFRETLGFGSEFCEQGAGAFIGTLDFVDDMPAVWFAEHYYTILAEGNDVGRTLLEAKHDVKINGRRIGVSQLLYSLYGNPYIRLRW